MNDLNVQLHWDFWKSTISKNVDASTRRYIIFLIQNQIHFIFVSLVLIII